MPEKATANSIDEDQLKGEALTKVTNNIKEQI